MALFRLLLLDIVVATIPQVVLGDSFSSPFVKKSCPGISLPPVTGRFGHHRGTAQIGEFEDGGFWFTNFTIGDAEDLVILIDTGSTDVYLNPGLYKPSPLSQNLHDNFTITFETTNPDGSGSLTISGPVYKDIVALDHTSLSVPDQPLGVVTDPSSPPTFPHDGLIGFAGLQQSALNASSWFNHLCDEGALDECRFGIAYETDSTGTQYFGKVEYDTFEGELSVAPLYLPGWQWDTYADIAANGKVIERDAMIITDSGTTVVFGPIASVQALFDATGVQSVLTPNTTADGVSTLNGYYPCDKPPEFGFNFPSITNATEARENKSSPVSHSSTIFNILPAALVLNSTGNNCSSMVIGTDEFDFWLVGQAFFQGRYIDHNVDDQTMGFANLIYTG